MSKQGRQLSIAGAPDTGHLARTFKLVTSKIDDASLKYPILVLLFAISDFHLKGKASRFC